MKTKTIRINDYIFTLSYNKEKVPITGNFLLYAHHDRDMSQKELEIGRAIQEDIFAGKYNNHLSNTQWDITI